MNKIFFFLLLLVISNNIYSQTEPSEINEEIESIHVDSFYENQSNYLIHSKIISLDSMNKEEIIKGVKNWGGVNFVNFKEVLVSETSDQLVINYIEKSFFMETFLTGKVYWNWYIRLVIEVKDNKMRVQYFDDGNVAVTGQYPLAARAAHLRQYFKKEDNTMCQKMFCQGFISLKKNITFSASSLETSLKKPLIKKDDW